MRKDENMEIDELEKKIENREIACPCCGENEELGVMYTYRYGRWVRCDVCSCEWDESERKMKG